MTYRDTVLKHLQKYDSITGTEAYEKYGILRLSGVILYLRRQGYNIITDKERNYLKDGRSYPCAKYRLVKEDNKKEMTYNEVKDWLKQEAKNTKNKTIKNKIRRFVRFLEDIENVQITHS